MSHRVAFEVFYEGAYPRVLRAVRPLVESPAAAQDVTQEAFARAYMRWDALDPVENIEGWVIGVARNLALSRLRHIKVALRKRPPIREETTDPIPAAIGRVDLARAMKELPPRQREVLGMHYLEDLPVQEIAARLGISPNNVKVSLHRGRTALSHELGRTDEHVDE